MKTIVIDARMIRSSGIGTYLQNMIPNMKNNFRLFLLGDIDELKSFSWSEDIKIINFTAPIYSLTEQILFPFIVPKCNIFLSPHYNVPVTPLRAKKQAVIIHDVYHLAFYSRLTGLQKMYAKFMINKAAKKSDKIITVSEFSKKEILKYTKIDGSKIKVIYCGLNPDEFSDNSDKDYSGLKIKYNLPEKFFLFVSNIKPHKNLYNLLLAYKNVLTKDNSHKLVVVGEYKKLITSDTHVFKLLDKEEILKQNTVFTGYVTKQDLRDLYRTAEALVFPSLYEGFGLPPVEAMICNCPVIASSVASLPEACGDAALYFDPYNVHDIEEKLMMFISDKNMAISLVEKGEENIKKFSWKNFSENLKKEFDSLI